MPRGGRCARSEQLCLTWAAMPRGGPLCLTWAAMPRGGPLCLTWDAMSDRAARAGRRSIQVTVNGRVYARLVEPRLLLSDFLRHELRLTGTHVGCEHGVCGACTVLVDEQLTRACLMLAIQADGASITTVEGLADGPGAEQLHPVQAAFWDAHGPQYDFC